MLSRYKHIGEIFIMFALFKITHRKLLNDFACLASTQAYDLPVDVSDLTQRWGRSFTDHFSSDQYIGCSGSYTGLAMDIEQCVRDFILTPMA